MNCCDMNARGHHCDCNPCGICEDKAEGKRQRQQRAQAWTCAIAFGIAVTVSAVLTVVLLGWLQGCRLDVYHVPPLPPRQDAGPGIIVGTGDLDAGELDDGGAGP